MTNGARRFEALTFPKELHGVPSSVALATVPIPALCALNRYAVLTGSAQWGDHCHRMEGGAWPGRKLTVTRYAAPLPFTFPGRVPPAVAIVPVTVSRALQIWSAT